MNKKKFLERAFVTHLPQKAARQGTKSTQGVFLTNLPQKAAPQGTMITILENTLNVNYTISCSFSQKIPL